MSQAQHISFNRELLEATARRDGCIIDYEVIAERKINRELRIQFKCSECGQNGEKTLRMMYGSGAFCSSCTQIKQLEKFHTAWANKCIPFEKSFASHPKSKCFSDDNPIRPEQLFMNSSTQKYDFVCDICHHKFEAYPSSVVSGCWCPYCSVPPKKLCKDTLCKSCLYKSFASVDKAAYWSASNKLSPREVFKNSNQTFTFDCPSCHHEFDMILGNIILENSWCPYCVNKKLCSNTECNTCLRKSFAGHEKACCWSSTNEATPRQVFRRTKDPFDFDCDICEHKFSATLDNISHGTWCPYCSDPPKQLCEDESCDICLQKSFASHCRSQSWSNTNQLKPRNIFKNANDSYFFSCDVCLHEFKASPNHITQRQSWCPYCSVPCKRLCPDEDCLHCFNSSFASHAKASCWSEKNNVNPRAVFKGTPTQYIFDCDECKTEFQTSPNNLKTSWCPNCVHKTSLILHKHLLAQGFEVVTEAVFEWCKNPDTNRFRRFDYAINNIKIIIELDGVQHFQQVANWQDPIITRNADVVKMKKAVDNGWTIIRVLQEDIYYSRIEWECELSNHLYLHDTPECIFIGNPAREDLEGSKLRFSTSSRT